MSFMSLIGSWYGGFGSDFVGLGLSVGRYGGGDDFRFLFWGFWDILV